MKLVYEYRYGGESYFSYFNNFYNLVYEDINGFHVYNIPYDGVERFYKTFDNFEEAKKLAESYT